jgi:hypothetical protein
MLEDLRAGLPLADLRQAGWNVDGPRPGPAGSTWVSASHSFSRLSQVPVLVADVAGSGPVAGRPFRVAVQEQKGALEDRFDITGSADLKCALACFDDPHLTQDVGYPLGLPPAELARLLGGDPNRDLTFRLEVSLPGRASGHGASGRARASGGATASGRATTVFTWAPVLGRSTSLAATTESVNVEVVRDLLLAVGAGAVVVLATPVLLLLRRRRRRHRGETVTEHG